jgi:hypothetical protein
MPAKWLYPDVPSYLIVSTLDLSNHGHHGNHERYRKMPWTRKLIDLAERLRDEGETWPAIANELADLTGVRIAAHSVEDYLKRGGGE